ncbi:hypothetical protein G6F65_022751 [Rhizopus arrhizus]|nr:hypothetical protein G6F65_022751 [Rhizopus arrhizus]
MPRLARGRARRRVSVDLDRGEQVVAHDPKRPRFALERGDRADGHHGAAIGTRLKIGNVGFAVALALLGLGNHPERAP